MSALLADPPNDLREPGENPAAYAAEVIATVEARMNLIKGDIRGDSRLRKITTPRQMVFALLYFGAAPKPFRLPPIPLIKVGAFTNRDHTTVSYGLAVIAHLSVTREPMRELLDALTAELRTRGWNVGPVTSHLAQYCRRGCALIKRGNA